MVNFRVFDFGSRYLKFSNVQSTNATTELECEISRESTTTVERKSQPQGPAKVVLMEKLHGNEASDVISRCTDVKKLNVYQALEDRDEKKINSYLSYMLENYYCDSVVIPLSICSSIPSTILEIMFEELNMKHVSFPRSATCTLASLGQTEGIVLDIGHMKTEISSLADGYINEHDAITTPLAGKAVSNSLMMGIEGALRRLLDRQDWRVSTLMEQLKIGHAFCSLVPFQEAHLLGRADRYKGTTLELPDGRTVKLKAELNTCYEDLITTSYGRPGIADLTVSLIESLPIDIRSSQLSNVVLSGGTSMCNSFSERIVREVKNAVKAPMSFDIVDNAMDAVAYGGTILPCLWNEPHVMAGERGSWTGVSFYEEHGGRRCWQMTN